MQQLAQSTDKTVKAFGESVCHALNNDSAKSHEAWLQVLKNGPPPGSAGPTGLNSDGTWFGGTDQRFYDYVNKPLSTFVRKLKTPCTMYHVPCTITKAITEPIEAHEARMDLSEVLASTPQDCHRTGIAAGYSCKGKNLYGPLEIPDVRNPPLYLVARNTSSLNGPKSFWDMPKTLRISGQQYQLGMLTMFDRPKAHFTSLHWVNGEFIYYDGLMASKKKFRRPLTTDYKQEIDHALYVKTVYNKTL